jgi:hypothetical protein
MMAAMVEDAAGEEEGVTKLDLSLAIALHTGKLGCCTLADFLFDCLILPKGSIYFNC